MAPFVLRVKGGEDTFFSPLENMHCEEDVSYAWRVSNKVRDALENGSRLENMSWRLWFRHQLLNQQKAAEKAKTEQLQQQQQLQLQQQFNQQQPNSTVSLSVTTTPLHEQHHHQFWFDQHHNPPPPPTKDLPDMMDYDDTNQFMLHNPNDFIFSMPPTKHVEHDNNNNNVQQQQQHEAEHQTPWPLAATEYDLQHTMQDTPTSFQPDHHLDSALASRMAAFSMQPMSMPPSPIMSHMPPMSMHHRPHDAIHNATAAAAVYVEQQQSTNTLLHTTSPPSSSTTLNRLLEQQQQQDTHAHHTHNHHHHHNHHGHPAARVRSRPQISLEIEGMTSSTATNNPSQLYHTHL
ncbi:hypothetical protein BDB00DRAFT_552447 [Zychaea mexicana]|uniref:uncharacterized protein n=1 Tax=Zychaea mexicana TaxID=64656 RepID=UPI0022FE8592|nr:uncharacterized protein BDB00DRAFT_552447 [Zychaea mexicana]KAI9490519.1 hypothetical protein BDB00DRAFT_552447 [Zychaea mexicana]